MEGSVDLQDNVDTSERIYRDDLKLFLGRNPEPFLLAYDRQSSGRHRSNYCWPAFFVPIAWFMYRRMYLYAGGILALGVLIAVIFPQHGTSGAAGISVAFCMMAKPAYLAFARGKIDKAGKKAVDETDRLRRIERAGGVSVVGAVIGGIITALPLIALFASHT